MRLAWFGTAGVAAALTAALAGACLLDLDHAIACGDGHVDGLAGEECDPAVPSSYVDMCAGTIRPGGEAACDPVTCTVINDKDQCAVCGDDIVDTEFMEECDGSQVPDECPGGEGALRCTLDCKFDYSGCESCGNELLDEGEECDPAIAGDLVAPRLCAGTEDEEPLEPIRAEKPYTWGQTTRCKDDCRYDRTPCGFCGDGTLDDGTELVDVGVVAPAEWCDGDTFDPTRLDQVFGMSFCTDDGERPNAGCGPGCRSFIDRTEDGARCCREKSEACPIVGETIQCCYQHDHPDEPPCEEFFEGPTIRRVCK